MRASAVPKAAKAREYLGIHDVTLMHQPYGLGTKLKIEKTNSLLFSSSISNLFSPTERKHILAKMVHLNGFSLAVNSFLQGAVHAFPRDNTVRKHH